MSRFVICADATPAIGLGHVGRCCSLSHQLVANGHDVVFTTEIPAPDVEAMISSSGASQAVVVPGVDAGERAAVVQSQEPDFVMVDGYHFTSEFFTCLESMGICHGVIDDNGETTSRAPELIVNQNPGIEPGHYRHLESTPELLLGLEFALIRPSLLLENGASPQHDRPSPYAFVSMGGSDPLHLTVGVVEVLTEQGLTVQAAIGPAVVDRDAVQSTIVDRSGVAVVEQRDYAGALANASFAVIGAGSTMWEAAALGVPTVSITVADNQRRPSQEAEQLGFTTVVDGARNDWQRLLSETVRLFAGDEEGRSIMATRGRQVVDGRGAARVAAVLGELAEASPDRASGPRPCTLAATNEGSG